MFSEKQIRILAFIATCTAVCMYVAYIPQIMNNLDGKPGNPWQPLVAAINGTLWVIYALFKKDRDFPVAISNAPGTFFGLATFITSLIAISSMS